MIKINMSSNVAIVEGSKLKLIIALVYIKNPNSNGMYRAQASIRNITMSPEADNTNSGGSLSIGLLMLLAAGSFVRCKKGQ